MHVLLKAGLFEILTIYCMLVCLCSVVMVWYVIYLLSSEGYSLKELNKVILEPKQLTTS